MLDKMRFVALAILAVQFCSVAAVEWEDPQVNSINRLPSRTYSVPLAAEKDALTDALEPETPYAISLNGDWKYSWTGNPDLRVMDFYRDGFDDSNWFTIDVPSCVEMRGYGVPHYANQKYPHADLSHPTNAAFASIRDRVSGKADYNPVSSYRRTFTVPESWRGRRVILRFDGVMSAYYVWMNGHRVGYAEDSFLPSEFDVTGFVVDGKNVLAVEVYKWCDGSYLEDQDMTRYSGIFRDVTLWSMPKEGIWDFAVKTAKEKGDAWSLGIEGVDGDWTATLYDAAFMPVANLSNLSNASNLLNVSSWSAEKPCLYTLVIKKGADIRMKRIGFKEQKVENGVFLVNGMPVKFKGVNRHETNPDNGRTVSRADMIRDAALMKQYNINMVRTSHYPDHRLWYDLCDRYGIYICAESNIEAHEPGYGEKGLGRFAEWNGSIVERNMRHVETFRNHPSVTMWSLGNETGHGICFTNAAETVRRIDPTRPIHWERGNAIADVDGAMYVGVDWLETRGRFGEGLCTAEDVIKADRWNRERPGRKPFFLTEYAHTMGNALGNYQEYWDVFYRYRTLSGGCIWDWIDQAVWKYTDRANPVTGAQDRYLAYGGDFDETPNDGPFNCNGVIGPGRKVSAKLIEVGHVHRNLIVTRKDDGSLELLNRNCFTWADEFDGTWELLADGEVVERGVFAVPHLAPLSRCDISTLLPHSAVAGKETFLNVMFGLKENCEWANKGWLVARNQVEMGNPSAIRLFDCPFEKDEDLKIHENEKTVTMTAGSTKAVFCRATGTLCELKLGGIRILKDVAPGLAAGPRLTCERAPTDNDRWLYAPAKEHSYLPFAASGLTQLRYHVRPIQVRDSAVRIVTEVDGMKSAGFTHEAVWRVAADGAVTMENTVTPHGTMPIALTRLGLSFRLDGALERMRYYGRGPHENYVDRKTAAFFGIYDSTVTEQYEEYVRPQDNGYRCDVRWAEFRNDAGRGVRFSASQPLCMQALHYGLEDLRLARPQRHQPCFRVPLVSRKEVCLNLDIRQTGIGNGSCGDLWPLEQYRFPIMAENWTLRIESIQR